MKRFFLPLLIVASVFLLLSGCENGGGPEQQAAQKQGFGEAKSGVGLVKGPTRPHPGWVSPSHPNMKSFQPGNDPIDGMPMVREGEWTCPNHPQVSATAPGKCPLDDVPLIKVQELEQKTGKSIAELTEEALAGSSGS